MPNLRQLEYLVALADTRHFRRAAERANTTQPTLSEQLKALEDRLGVQLVERTRAKVVLTAIGQQVVEIARRMLADSSEIKALAASGGRELSGLVRLGLPPTIGPYLLPHVIPELHRTYPGLRLYVREDLPAGLPGALEEGALDVIITPLPVRGADIVVTPLFREPLHLATAADHPFAAAGVVTRERLAGQDVLALGPGHQLHDVAIGLCEELGARLRRDYEGTSLDTLREMVAMGLGITFLPGLYVRSVASRDASVATMEIQGRSVYRTVGMAWRRTSARQHDCRLFAQRIRAVVARDLDGIAVLEE